jgi:hypothetical protein
VNKPAEGVTGHHSDQPQDQKNHEDRPKHFLFPPLTRSTSDELVAGNGHAASAPSGVKLLSECDFAGMTWDFSM